MLILHSAFFVLLRKGRFQIDFFNTFLVKIESFFAKLSIKLKGKIKGFIEFI